MVVTSDGPVPIRTTASKRRLPKPGRLFTLRATQIATMPSATAYAPKSKAILMMLTGTSPGQTSTTTPKIIAIAERSSRKTQLTASAASIGRLLSNR
jgi:hypothetical protein